MTDLVGVASNAVESYQRALGTVSNNIANVATDGYSRQEVVLQASPISKVGNIFMGTGVMVDRIKRQYDSFVEANLRNSSSDLASQEPMVNYANRVIDVMGGQTMGLTSALDQFFSSSRELATDPASSVVRNSFVRDAQGLASRFGDLSSQLDLVQDETRQALSSSVAQMNTLTTQLAQVNGQLTKQRTVNAQPSELLDQRDRLLKELANFAHVNTNFKENGEVTVSLGPSITQDVIVNGSTSISIAANFNSASPEKVSLVLDPYGKPSTLAGVTSGQLSGLMAFREQVLGSTRSALDNLASVFTKEVNAIHQQGVDAYGNPGGDLFTIDPSASSVAGGMKVAFDDPLKVAAAAQFRVIENANNTGGASATLSYSPEEASGPSDLQQVLVNNPNPTAAINLDITQSKPIRAVATIAQGMQDVAIYLDGADTNQQLQVITKDGRLLVGAMDAPLQSSLINTTNGFAQGANFSDSYLDKSGAAGYKGMNVFYGAKAEVLQEPVYDSEGKPALDLYGNPRFNPIPASLDGGRMQLGQDQGIASGSLVLNDVALTALNPAAGTSLQAKDVADWINQAVGTGVTALASNEIRIPAAGQAQQSTSLGFAAANTLLNGGSAFKLSLTVAHGDAQIVTISPVNATPAGIVTAINASGLAIKATLIKTGDLNAPYKIVVSNANGTLGKDNSFSIISKGNLNGPVPGVTFSSSVQTDGKATLKLDLPLSINGHSIVPPTGGFANALAMANAINLPDSGISATGVTATVSSNGELVLSNTDGSDIAIARGDGLDSLGNALGVPAGVYRGQVSLSRADTSSPIKLSFGANGTPADLAKLGFRTAAYLSGPVKEDLLVFVTGAGQSAVSASYSGTPVDSKQGLRAENLKVTFTSASHYTITSTDAAGASTEVADREFDPSQLNPGISYRGLHMSFTTTPHAGDSFVMDGNVDGTGNNENMLNLAALEKKALIGGSKTLGTAYIDQVNEMGNIARQATIAKAALTVVNQQAVSARDQVSGVSLDQEAADLIRFQQAYQAAAKVLQVASQLFDSVLQVR